MLFAKQDHVATITLNRPDRMNAWTTTMEQELRELLSQASRDDEVRVIVLTGAGRAFCAGADMGRLVNSANSVPGTLEQSAKDDLDQRYSYIMAVPKPVLAGINGAVAGVGLCLTLFCDLRYMAAGTKLTTAFARRGLIAEHGSAWMLRRLIGPMNAADILLTGRPVEAEEAERMGLVRVLPREDFHQQLQSRAAEIAALCSPRSQRVIKRQLNQAIFQSLAEATRLSEEEALLCRGTDDYKEGVAHFVEKRAPRFTGT
ncbi:enoyl-CoA hydratase-related protein [Sabulicella rubraurantiaca]|uniref:enoyl-CoA hydratase-related protein n=1 Tax=Sabulicella rubraurantiaca TaxID=2811429 RepID=UPI001F2EEEDB|nr:enoyl-CoA hydratase-related protein [Sabulicella rubraurantiaca]